MLKLITFCATALALALPANAQQVIATYDAQISQQDLVNSSGNWLGDLCAVVQQDRANYHRFRKPDFADMNDPIFANREMRARIASSCELAPGEEFMRDLILSRNNFGILIRVVVLNDAGRMRVIVSQRAG